MMRRRSVKNWEWFISRFWIHLIIVMETNMHFAASGFMSITDDEKTATNRMHANYRNLAHIEKWEEKLYFTKHQRRLISVEIFSMRLKRAQFWNSFNNRTPSIRSVFNLVKAYCWVSIYFAYLNRKFSAEYWSYFLLWVKLTFLRTSNQLKSVFDNNINTNHQRKSLWAQHFDWFFVFKLSNDKSHHGKRWR